MRKPRRVRIVGRREPFPRIINVVLQTLVAIVASIIGVLASLSTLVMLAAGMANAKPAHLAQGKFMMWSIVAMQVLALAAAIWLMVKHKPWPAAAVGIVPLAAVIVLIVVLVVIEW